jgi:hypothetical protein
MRALFIMVTALGVCGCGPRINPEESHNLHSIGAAFQKFHETNGVFPRVNGTEDNNASSERIGLSWRVHLLPHLGYQELYDKFALDESWDSDTNKPLLNQMPREYVTSGAAKFETSMHVFVDEQSGTDNGPFRDPGALDCRGVRLQGLLNASFTVLAAIAEPSTAEPWTKPGYLRILPKSSTTYFDEVPSDVHLLMANGDTLSFESESLTEWSLYSVLSREKRSSIKITVGDSDETSNNSPSSTVTLNAKTRQAGNPMSQHATPVKKSNTPRTTEHYAAFVRDGMVKTKPPAHTITDPFAFRSDSATATITFETNEDIHRVWFLTQSNARIDGGVLKELEWTVGLSSNTVDLSPRNFTRAHQSIPDAIGQMARQKPAPGSITFKSTQIRKEGENYRVEGTISCGEHAQNVTYDANLSTKTETRKTVYGDRVITSVWIENGVVIKLSEFGGVNDFDVGKALAKINGAAPGSQFRRQRSEPVKSPLRDEIQIRVIVGGSLPTFVRKKLGFPFKKSDLQTWQAQTFLIRDGNNDGNLTGKEVPSFFKSRDKNEDGKITLDEVKSL